MKKIAIVTTTRADYGLLAPIIKKLRYYETEKLKIELIVTGTHLSKKYGYTVEEIKADDVRIDHFVQTSVKSNSEWDISQNQSDTLLKFTHLFLKEKYHAVTLLGDRYETLAIAIAAGNMKIPVFHLCGGDTTEGAIDEWIRHSITKISYLHFTTNEKSRQRVIQLGEEPKRVFNYGSTSIDNILNTPIMPKKEVLHSVGLSECRYAVCTYHPVTMDNTMVDNYIQQFLSAIKYFSEIEFIVTKSNADHGGARINKLLDQATEKIKNLHVFYSLGTKRYLSLMRYAEFVLGNSSSGIIEAPTFKVPTINIGDRQKGRLQSNNTINCNTDTQSIINAIKKAMDVHFQRICHTVTTSYGDGHASEQISKKIVEVIMDEKINLQKKFYDMDIKK